MTTAAVPSIQTRSYEPAWWGMAGLITAEAMAFAILLASYFYLRASSPAWPLGGIAVPDLHLSLPFSFVLWGSSVPIFYAESSIRRGQVARFRIAAFVSFAMGVAFLAYTVHDFDGLRFGWRDNAYGSIYYTIVGFHALHVLIGLAMSAVVQVKAALGRVTAEHHRAAEVFSLYWHFVDVVWLLVFASLFLSPRLR